MRGLIMVAATAALLAAAPANAVQIYTFYLHVLGKIAVGERATYIAGAIDRPVTLRDAGIDKNLAHRAPNLIIRATAIAIGLPPRLGRSSFDDRSR
jgi:hypothetical protein